MLLFIALLHCLPSNDARNTKELLMTFFRACAFTGCYKQPNLQFHSISLLLQTQNYGHCAYMDGESSSIPIQWHVSMIM